MSGFNSCILKVCGGNNTNLEENNKNHYMEKITQDSSKEMERSLAI